MSILARTASAGCPADASASLGPKTAAWPRRAVAVALLVATANLFGQAPPEPVPLPSALASLGEKTTEVVKGHQSLYLGTKTPEAAARMPAVLWYIGEPMTRGGDLAKLFEPARALGANRNAAVLEALAKSVGELAPKAEALTGRAHDAAEVSRALAARVAAAANAGIEASAWPRPAKAPRLSEPEMLYAAALSALVGQTPDYAQAAFYLAELAARLDHLADLDRWLVLNCKWLVESNAWTKEEGMAPRSLCFCISARFNEVAFLQSRVEDILFALDAERDLWVWLAARHSGKPVPSATAPDRAKALAKTERRIAELRKQALAADRQASALGHQRRIKEAIQVVVKTYLPLAAELEHLQRETALRKWAGGNAPGEIGLTDLDAAGLSLTARAALAGVTAALDRKEAHRLAPVLKDMLGRDYLASYADLCLYQAAVMATEKELAVRISRWLALSSHPDPLELMDILHATPGVMTTSQRGDNAYQPRIMQWASQCKGTREDRFKKARELTNAFYRKHGYNRNKPANSMRDVLESGLVDCIAAGRIFGSVATAAGVPGVVPVRYWKRRLGHTLVGLREGNRVFIMDPLTAGPARSYPGGYRDVMTVEIGAPSFGCHVVCDIEIVSTGKRLTRELPYLRPAGASRE